MYYRFSHLYSIPRRPHRTIEPARSRASTSARRANCAAIDTSRPLMSAACFNSERTRAADSLCSRLILRPAIAASDFSATRALCW